MVNVGNGRMGAGPGRADQRFVVADGRAAYVKELLAGGLLVDDGPLAYRG